MGFFFFGLATLDVLLEVAPLDQILDLVLQLSALLYGVPNVFGIRIVFILIGVRLMSEWVKAVHEGLIGDGVQDLFSVGH